MVEWYKTYSRRVEVRNKGFSSLIDKRDLRLTLKTVIQECEGQ
jgi:hypothetical protein